MIRALHLPPDGAAAIELQGEEARKALVDPQRTGLWWVDITNQGQKDIDLLAQAFKFHPLALEDCLHFDQRPKLEEYAGQNPYLFIVTHTCVTTPSLPEGPPGDENSMIMQRHVLARGRKRSLALQILEVHAFLGQTFLVTVHADPSTAVESVYQRVRHDGTMLNRGLDFIYYLLVDVLTDANFPVLEQIGDLLDDLEGGILRNQNPTRDDLACIYSLRRALVTMRRALSPQRDIMGALFRQGGGPCVHQKTAPYFRDTYDHLTRIYESIEAGRDLLASCIDAYLSTVGQRTNDIMRQLTILSCALLPMTFVTGFFGMNFQAMPFHSSAWFWAAMAAMFIAIPIGIYLFFRRKGWISDT
jgi:magnesium transporter